MPDASAVKPEDEGDSPIAAFFLSVRTSVRFQSVTETDASRACSAGSVCLGLSTQFVNQVFEC